jgi:hypothetical protein
MTLTALKRMNVEDITILGAIPLIQTKETGFKFKVLFFQGKVVDKANV